MSCMIVCPLACQNCDITPCEDRLAEENAMASTGLDEFWSGRKGGKGTIIPNIYGEQTVDMEEAEALKHCGMKSDLICRHCADTTCTIRMAPRRY